MLTSNGQKRVHERAEKRKAMQQAAVEAVCAVIFLAAVFAVSFFCAVLSD